MLNVGIKAAVFFLSYRHFLGFKLFCRTSEILRVLTEINFLESFIEKIVKK